MSVMFFRKSAPDARSDIDDNKWIYRDPDPAISSEYGDLAVLDLLPPDRARFDRMVDGWNTPRWFHINASNIQTEMLGALVGEVAKLREAVERLGDKSR